jgi:hypothetical protein
MKNRSAPAANDIVIPIRDGVALTTSIEPSWKRIRYGRIEDMIIEACGRYFVLVHDADRSAPLCSDVTPGQDDDRVK